MRLLFGVEVALTTALAGAAGSSSDVSQAYSSGDAFERGWAALSTQNCSTAGQWLEAGHAFRHGLMCADHEIAAAFQPRGQAAQDVGL